jgi:carbonic anhydrase
MERTAMNLLGRSQTTRRRMLAGTGAAGVLAVAFGRRAWVGTARAGQLDPITGDEALQRLLEGNRRYVAGQPQHPNQSLDRRAEVAGGQHPFAFVLGCYDSRVSHELVFDQGLGDIFSSRVAAGLLDDAVIGGIEFGVEEFEVPLVLVLGHQRCGAIAAAVNALQSGAALEGKVGSVVEALRPAVELAEAQAGGGDLVDSAVRANVVLNVARLRASSVLAAHLEDGSLKLAGGYYSLDTGQVEMLV